MTEPYKKLFDGQGCLDAVLMVEKEAEQAGYQRACDEYKADAELWREYTEECKSLVRKLQQKVTIYKQRNNG